MKDGISKHLLQAGGARKRCHSIPPVSERKFPKFLRSLSVSLPPEPHRCCGVQSSDLLATVVTNEEEKELMPNESQVDSTPTSTIPNRLGMSSENLKKMLRLTQRDGGRTPVITYPKYIPSYAVPVPEKGSPPSPATPVPSELLSEWNYNVVQLNSDLRMHIISLFMDSQEVKFFFHHHHPTTKQRKYSMSHS